MKASIISVLAKRKTENNRGADKRRVIACDPPARKKSFSQGPEACPGTTHLTRVIRAPAPDSDGVEVAGGSATEQKL